MKKISVILTFLILISTFVPVYAQTQEWNFVNAYEDFESYADASDETYTNTSVINLKELDIVNGGAGWSGGWYDNASGTISGGHQLSLAQTNYPWTLWREFDLFTGSHGSSPLKRNFITPIDFTKAGEYYIKIKGQPAHSETSTWMSGFDMKISIGDSITFGAKYVEGKSAHTTSPYMYPYLNVGNMSVSKSDSTADGVLTGRYSEYVVKLVTDGTGKVDVTYTLADKTVLTASASGFSSAEYLGISGGGTLRISYIKVDGCSKAQLDNIRSKFTDISALDDVMTEIDKLGDVAKEVLSQEFMTVVSKKYQYDDFESYVDAEDTQYDASSKISLSSLAPLNGGYGWSGGWYDNASGTISGGHNFMLTCANYPFYQLLREIDIHTTAHGTNPLKRNFATPIDFTEAGEYYVKLKGQPAVAYNSQWMSGYDMKISLGDKISFGTKYVDGKTVSETSPYFYPYLTLGETTVSKSDTTDDGIYTGGYYDYFVRIITDGTGSAEVTYTLADRVVLTGSVSGLTSAENICVSGGGTIRISDIMIERYTAEELAAAKEAINKLARDEFSYSQALAEVNKITGLAYKPLLDELNENHGYVKVVNARFTDSDGNRIINKNNVGDNLTYSFKLYNNYKTDVETSAFLAMYNDGKLQGLKGISSPVLSKVKTEEFSLGFDEVADNSDFKFFVWDKNSYKPFTEVISLYSDEERVKAPHIFGEDIADDVTVVFMGDSITHMNPSYTKWIEYYYRIKYPTKNIKFASKGIGGDHCSGIIKRFYWDILNDPNTGTPDEACLMIGMNDVTRGLYPDVGTEDEKQAAIDVCLSNIEEVVRLCKNNNVKLTLITPPIYDEAADYTSDFNCVGVNSALGTIAEGVIKIANENNLPYIDFYSHINAYNTEIRKKPEFANGYVFNVNDRIHANKNGAFAEGFIFLCQQIAEPVSVSVAIDKNTLSSEAENAEVSGVSYGNNTLSYTYTAGALPIYMSEEYQTNENTFGLPVTECLNNEIIKVSGLDEGSYKIMFDDSELGVFTSSELEKGVNIATLSGNPGYVQSQEVYDLVSQKMIEDVKLRDLAYVERSLEGKVDLTDADACIQYLKDHFSTSSDGYFKLYPEKKALQAEIVETIAKLENDAMSKAQPKTYTVYIIPSSN